MMERPQAGCLPTLEADVEKVKRELEQMYQAVKTNCGERQEPAPASLAGGMVIKGK